MTEVKARKLVVIDGKSVFYRGYYAMPNLSTKDGTPTGGVFGFASMALEVVKRLRPDYVAVAWDKPKTNIRSRLAIYPEYKAGRKPAPPDFYEQIPVLHELLEAFGWPLYEMDDYEADDLMGTLAKQASEQGIETLLITSDLDALQLVGPLTKVYALKKGLSNIELFSPESFSAKYGLEVKQFLDLKSLKGDSSDNIPGVPGIGEKTAIQLLQEYKTLDNIYDNLVLLKDSVRLKLEAGKESAYMSKKLGAIWCDAPLPLDLPRMDGHHANAERIAELLEKLEFRSLARQVPDILKVDLAEHASQNVSRDLQIPKNILIDSEDALSKVVIESGAEVVIHSRAAGVAGRDPKVLIVSADPRTVYTIDLTKVAPDRVVTLLLNQQTLIGYDVKSSLKTLLGMSMPPDALPPVTHDVLVGAFIINALRREQSLTELSGDIGYDGSPFEDLSDEDLMARAPEIVAVIRALAEQQQDELDQIPKLRDVATHAWNTKASSSIRRIFSSLPTKLTIRFLILNKRFTDMPIASLISRAPPSLRRYCLRSLTCQSRALKRAKLVTVLRQVNSINFASSTPLSTLSASSVKSPSSKTPMSIHSHDKLTGTAVYIQLLI